MKRTVEYLGKTEDGFAEYEISESYEDDTTSKVYQPEKIEYPRPKKAQTETSSPKDINPSDEKGSKTMKTEVYKNSLEYAVAHNEKRLYSESFGLNIDCACAITKAITENRCHQYSLNSVPGILRTVINDFGMNRVTWVIAANVQYYGNDRWLSSVNKDWAQEFSIPDRRLWKDILIKTQVGVVNGFANELRDVLQREFTLKVETGKEPTGYDEANKIYMDNFVSIYHLYLDFWEKFDDFKEFLKYMMKDKPIVSEDLVLKEDEPIVSEVLVSMEDNTTTKESQPEPTSNKRFLKLDKEEFLKTEFGAELKSTLELLDWNLTMTWDCNNYRDKDAIKRLRAQWDIFKLALKQFYGIEYAFTRTDEYFGVCTEDESDWLFKVDRKIDGKGLKS